LRDFLLAFPLSGKVIKIVAKFGGNRDLVALSAKSLGEYRLTPAVSIGISRIVENNSEIKRLLKQFNGVLIAFFPPPAGGKGPKAKPDL
jgi:hypothetical protein